MQDETLKVIFITQDEPYYMPRYIDKTLAHLGKETKVIKVYALPPFLPQKNYFQTIQYYFSYFGFAVFAYLVFLRIFYIIYDFLNNCLKINSKFHSIKLICRKYKIPFAKIKKVNSKLVLNELRRLNPDIIFSLASPQIFGKELLAIPQKTCLNIHSSLLPKYRGVNANFWTLLKGERSTGITIHYMKQEIDAGKILLQKELKIENNWSLNDLCLHIIDLGAKSIAESLIMISEGKKAELENEALKGSYFSFPTKKDAKEFRDKRKKFFSLI